MNQRNNFENILDDINAPVNYELAITGDAFQWMLDFASDETFERVMN